MIKWRKYPEYIEFMKSFIPGHSEQEITEAFAEEFGIVLTKTQISNFKNTYHVKSGTTGGQFQKGQPSHNKGQKLRKDIYKKIQPTMFRKGHIPINHKEVGSERINVDGYTEIKVAEPNKWKLKQRYVWEQYYGIKLTSNDVIIFLDGNRQNFDIDNLYKLSRAGLARYNQDHLYTDVRQISQAAAQIAEIKDKMSQMKEKK